jgi:type VI secretion system secreted protein Hcp
MASRDYFLEIDGIKGESTDAKHKEQLDIESFSWGATNAGSFSQATGVGGGTGKVNFQDLHCTKQVDKSSPLLAKACATGQHIKQALLTVRKAGGQQQEYYTVKMTDVLISSFQSGGSAHAENIIPLEQFSLNFAKIEFNYAPQDAKGNLGSKVVFLYDLKQNK